MKTPKTTTKPSALSEAVRSWSYADEIRKNRKQHRKERGSLPEPSALSSPKPTQPKADAPVETRTGYLTDKREYKDDMPAAPQPAKAAQKQQPAITNEQFADNILGAYGAVEIRAALPSAQPWNPAAATEREQQLAAELELVKAALAARDAFAKRLERQYGSVKAELVQAKDEHCRDCCCARAWEALGDSVQSVGSIPEHIRRVKVERDEAIGIANSYKWYLIKLISATRQLLRYAEAPTETPSETALHQANAAITAAEGKP